MQKRELKTWQLFVLLLLGFALTAVGIMAMLIPMNAYTITMDGPAETEITLEYDMLFEAPVVTAQVVGSIYEKEPQQIPVTVDGKVEQGVVGDYTLTYSAFYRKAKLEKKQLIHIVDTQPPVITLVADPDYFTFPGSSYKEEGFQAEDGYDGWITNRVNREEKDGKVYYTVADAAGNETQVIREIRYDDPIAPELTLKGDTEISIYRGGKAFVDPGYTAVDNCDGNMTDKVVVTGEVDVDKPGTYEITYSVTDSYNNTTTAKRVVEVKNPPYNASMPSNPKGGVIYLTFDDGPSGQTPRLLDILAKYGVKATFFVVKNGNSNTISRIAAEGHSVGIHSVSHVYHWIYASEEAFFEDLYTMQDLIREKTGITTYLMRFPGGSSNTASNFNKGIMTRLTQLVKEKGFRYFDWNVTSGDAGGVDTEDGVFYNVIHGCANKSVSIVLQHDTKWFSVDAVERILQWGLANGYTFQPLDMDSPVCEHRVNN